MGRRWTGFKRQLQLQLIDLRLSECKSKSKTLPLTLRLQNFYGRQQCQHGHGSHGIFGSLTLSHHSFHSKYDRLDDSVFMVCRSCGNCSQAPTATAHGLQLPPTEVTVTVPLVPASGPEDTDSGSVSCDSERSPTPKCSKKFQHSNAKMTTLNNSTENGENNEVTTTAIATMPDHRQSSTGSPDPETNSATLRFQIRPRQRRTPCNTGSGSASANHPKQFLTWSASAANHKLQKLSKNLVSSVAKLQNKMDKVKFPFNVNNVNSHANGVHCETNGGGAGTGGRGRDRGRRPYDRDRDPAASYLNSLIGNENAYTCGPEEFNNNNNNVVPHKDNSNCNNFAQNGIPGTSDNIVSIAVVQNLRKRNNHATSNANNSNNLNTTNSTRKIATATVNVNHDNTNANSKRNINDSLSSSSSTSSSSSSYPKLTQNNRGGSVHDDENNFNMLEMRPITAAISKQILQKSNNNNDSGSGSDNKTVEAVTAMMMMNLRSSSSHDQSHTAVVEHQQLQKWSSVSASSASAFSTGPSPTSQKQRSNNNCDDKTTTTGGAVAGAGVDPPPSGRDRVRGSGSQNQNKKRNDHARDDRGGDDDEFGFGSNKVILKGIRSQELHHQSKLNSSSNRNGNGGSKMYNYNSCNRNGGGRGPVITNCNSNSTQSVSSTTPLLAQSASAQSLVEVGVVSPMPIRCSPPPLPLTQPPVSASAADAPVAATAAAAQLTLAIFEEEADLRHAAWFQGGIPREIALEVLRNEPIGSFIVRESTTKVGCLALSLRVPRQYQPATGIAHYLILKTGKGYKIKGFTKEFGSLSSLITHHSVLPELLPCPLSLHLYRGKYCKKTSGRFNSADFVEPEKLISSVPSMSMTLPIPVRTPTPTPSLTNTNTPIPILVAPPPKNTRHFTDF